MLPSDFALHDTKEHISSSSSTCVVLTRLCPSSIICFPSLVTRNVCNCVALLPSLLLRPPPPAQQNTNIHPRSTYLFIGATSPLTYNVVGHLKTVFIVTSGIVFFGDTITMKKFIGVACAMGGIVWYTSTGIVPAAPPPSSSSGNDKV